MDHNIRQAEGHSELPRPHHRCPLWDTLWTQQPTQVLWCSWVLGQGGTQGAFSIMWRYRIGFDHNIGQAERHSELPRSKGCCPFSGTLCTHESTQVLWCSWALGQGSTQGAISRKLRYKIGFDHNIWQAERHSELPLPNGWCPFSGTLWTHESIQVLWCSWVLGQWRILGGDIHKVGLITILVKLNAIGYPKMDISHWDAVIHYGVHLAQYCDQTRSCNAILGRSPPCVLTCPRTQEHQCTCVDSWVHRVPENGHQPLGRGNSLWRSACPILWSNPIL